MTELAPDTRPPADLYLRLSDFRQDDDGSFPARRTALEAKATDLGWRVNRVVIENDTRPDGSRKPASAWKRTWTGRTTENGRKIYRVERPGWRSIIADLETGAATAVLAEDLDRTCRDMADLLDLLDAIRARKGNARSLSGSLTLTNGGTDDEHAFAQFMVTMAGKSSADTARRVAAGRERWAGQSYQGGKRPFGYQPDPDAPKYHKMLIIVEAEAEVIRQAAVDFLDKGISLKAITAGLRKDRVPTVTGAAWTPSTLRDVLLKPANAGLTVHPVTRELIDAPWPAIFPDQPEEGQPGRAEWERLRDELTDPARTTTPGNEPRWLVSKIARCQCGTTVRVNGVARGRAAYVCEAGGHLKRAAARVDALVEGRMIWRLSQKDIQEEGLLLPPPRSGVDTSALNAEKRRLNKAAGEKHDLHTEGLMTAARLRTELRKITDRLNAIQVQLNASNQADPLPEFRNRPADVVWDSLTVARKRAVVKLLADITFLPVAPSGPKFNPDSVHIEWKA